MATNKPAPDEDELQEVPLPLEVAVEPRVDGWTVRAPLRTEVVTVEKVVTPYTEVRVRAQLAQDVVRLSDMVRREELTLETEGDLDVRQAPAADRPSPT